MTVASEGVQATLAAADRFTGRCSEPIGSATEIACGLVGRGSEETAYQGFHFLWLMRQGERPS